jgi:hypothetical protein
VRNHLLIEGPNSSGTTFGTTWATTIALNTYCALLLAITGTNPSWVQRKIDAIKY